MRNKSMRRRVSAIIVSIMMAVSLAACGGSTSTSDSENVDVSTEVTTRAEAEEDVELASDGISTDGNVTVTANVSTDGMIDTTDMFTDRDLEQTADLTEAETLTLSDGEDITIDSEGVYIISGDAKDVTINVEAGEEDKVQIVLDGVKLSNEDAPCIYVKTADKVFVTTTDTENSLEVTGTYVADGDTNLDAVIFSKEDLTINGLGTLSINSSDNGITSKDTLKITGSTLNITCSGSALEAHEAIEMAEGTVNVSQCNDGMHAEDSDDDSVGYIYICGGTVNISSADDAIHATTIVQIDDGSFTLDGGECIEGTYLQINGGDIDITASDDGVNAASKSSSYTPTFEMNDGNLTIQMGAGDTDAIDANGNIIINGGTIDITAQSPFDYDGTAELNGGTLIINGEETDSITNQMMGGGMGGMPQGGGMLQDGEMPQDGSMPQDGEMRTPPTDGTFPGGGKGGTPPEGGRGPRQNTTETEE